MSHVLVVQHVEAEGPALLGEAMSTAGLAVRVHRADLDGPPPADLQSLAGLIVLGGPMSAYRDEEFPTRRAELALLASAVTARLPVLGVCLGAQLLAEATGGVSRPGSVPEVGWGQIQQTEQAGTDTLFGGLPTAFDVLHWHADTYHPPPGAVRLAESDRYPEQAFRLGPAAWGLQFHVELDRAAVGRLASAFPQEAASAPDLLADLDARLAQLAPVREQILGRFCAVVAASCRGLC